MMKKLLAILVLSHAFVAYAQPDHLVISQVYGAGGNTGASYKYDYVELYNPTSAAVSLAGWSLQYAGATSANWSSNKVTLSGSVLPGKYFLVQCGNPGSEGIALPTPDFTGTNPNNNISLSTSAGKVALVNNTTLLTGNCPLPNAAIIDFVGYGNADCFEMAAATGPVSGNTTSSINRLNNGCTDADNSSADFVLATASPRNSSSNGHTCNSTNISITSVTPNPFCVNASSSATGSVSYSASGAFSASMFKAVMSDAAGSFGFSTVVGSAFVSGTDPSGTISITIPANTPPGTGYKVRIEATNPPLTGSQSTAFEIINGAKNVLPNEFSSAANNGTITLNWINPTGCFDEIMIVAKEGSSISGTPAGNGSAYTANLNFTGNGTSFDGGKVVYRGTASGQAVTNLANYTTYYFKAYTRRGTVWSSGTEISDKPRIVPLPGEIVIDQFSPDYNNALDEYIELVNLTGKAFDLADVSIDVKDKNGTHVVAGATLSGTLQPHSYWLIAPLNVNAITVGQTTALASDNAIDLGFANNNQLALLRKTDNTILDAVGFGTINTPTYTEGTVAVNPPTDGGLRRITSGADANNNATDFTTVPTANIELRNGQSRLANASASITAGSYTTLEITGNSALSGSVTLSDKAVLTSGRFTLGNYNLTTPKVTAGSESKYIKTSGAGALTITNVTSDVTFPVGNSTYNPVTISGGGGLNWAVSVADTLAPAAAFNRQYAVQRTWTITPSATPSSGATVVFEYNDNDASQIGSNFNKAKQVQVWSNHTGVWQAVTDPITPVLKAGRKAVTLSNYALFSPFVIVNIDAPLPVRFTGFSARAQDDGVKLQFTNASETAVAHYTIERSSDGHLFKTLIQLEPQSNNGGAVTYHWLDASPATGYAWYRVRGVDLDGTERFTPTLRINAGAKQQTLLIYPNPVRENTLTWQATLPQGIYHLNVVNSLGQPVLQQVFNGTGGTTSQTLQLPTGLAPGVYCLQLRQSGLVQQQAFVVQ